MHSFGLIENRKEIVNKIIYIFIFLIFLLFIFTTAAARFVNGLYWTKQKIYIYKVIALLKIARAVKL